MEFRGNVLDESLSKYHLDEVYTIGTRFRDSWRDLQSFEQAGLQNMFPGKSLGRIEPVGSGLLGADPGHLWLPQLS
jgi:hypothetical protein